jgi:hypothetical protein
MSTERRNFIRVTFSAPAQLLALAGKFSVKVHDLSFKGALVTGKEALALPLGTQCELHVILDTGSTQIDMNAEIAHKEGDQIGLLCRNIDIDSMTHLRRLIELQLGDPSLLELELSELLARAR